MPWFYTSWIYYTAPKTAMRRYNVTWGKRTVTNVDSCRERGGKGGYYSWLSPMMTNVVANATTASAGSMRKPGL